MMDADYLNVRHQYRLSDLDQTQVNGDLVAIKDYGRRISTNDPEFQVNYNKLGGFPPKLLDEAMITTAEIMHRHSLKIFRY